MPFHSDELSCRRPCKEDDVAESLVAYGRAIALEQNVTSDTGDFASLQRLLVGLRDDIGFSRGRSIDVWAQLLEVTDQVVFC
jgi:hypothetical protein